MIKLRKIHLIIDYILFLILLYLSGTIFGISFYYKVFVFVALGAVTIAFLFANKRKRISFIDSTIWIVLSITILLVALMNDVPSYSSYFAIILQLFTTLLFTQIVSYKTFEKIYVNVFVFLAFVSIICFFIYQLFPQIALLFPYYKGTASLDYYNAYIYIFGSVKGYGTFIPFYRNMGICWEPGAYQAFLNLALILLIDSESIDSPRNIVFRIIVLIVAILTTYSTTGYLILLLVVISRLRKISALLKIDFKFLGTLTLGFALIFVLSNLFDFSFIKTKIIREFGSSLSFLDRLGISNIKLLYLDPLSIFGLSFEKYNILANEMFSGIVGNSWIQSLLSLGIIFTSILTTMYAMFCKQHKNPFVFFLILMAMFWTESLFWRPIFLCLAWYGTKGQKSD